VSLTFVTSNGFEVKTRYLNMCIYNKTQNESKLLHYSTHVSNIATRAMLLQNNIKTNNEYIVT